MKYPFYPKSNSKLEVGEFWAIKLPNNKYACGIVLDIPDKEKQRVRFLAGLIDWLGLKPPSNKTFQDNKVKIAQYGFAHIKTITSKGEEIIGKISINTEGEEFIADDNISTWGFEFINLLAENLSETT